MNPSRSILNYIKTQEGFRALPYPDNSTWSIGYGHNLGTSGGSHRAITEWEAEAYLIKDITLASNTVNIGVTVPLNQNQYDALVDFVYNIGSGNFMNSTLLKKINSKAPKSQIRHEFNRWIYNTTPEGKVVVPALVKRRKYEADLFMRPGWLQKKKFQSLSLAA